MILVIIVVVDIVESLTIWTTFKVTIYLTIGMGFDAIWISPIIDNRDGGYHGYWGRDLYRLNDNFGSENDFRDFVSACH